MDNITQKRIEKLHPHIREEMKKIIRECDATLTGRSKVRITQGLRTFKEQDALYAIGRTLHGKKVTNAKGGQSIHNYGFAVDICLIIDGKTASLYENNEIWMTHPTKVYPKGHKFAGKPKRFRLDSWDKGAGMIVSRKATNLAEINKDTFIKYCNEISEKYPPGSKIANSEIGDKLYGKYYLEIPDTNLKFDKIDEYKKIAENLSVELIFKPE